MWSKMFSKVYTIKCNTFGWNRYFISQQNGGKWCLQYYYQGLSIILKYPSQHTKKLQSTPIILSWFCLEMIFLCTAHVTDICLFWKSHQWQILMKVAAEYNALVWHLFLKIKTRLHNAKWQLYDPWSVTPLAYAKRTCISRAGIFFTLNLWQLAPVETKMCRSLCPLHPFDITMWYLCTTCGHLPIYFKLIYQWTL